MESFNQLSTLLGVNPLLILVLAAWVLAWKGVAMWRAAQLQQKWWFIAILLINTLGILEIIYIFGVTRKYKVEIVEETK